MNKTDKEIKDVQVLISKILRIGVLISALVILIGLFILLVTNNTGYPHMGYPHNFVMIWQGLFQGKAAAIIMFGIFLLILTPVLRVVISIYAFFKDHDHLYVGITTAVLIILLVSMFLGAQGI